MLSIWEKKAKYEALLQEASKAYLSKQYSKACTLYYKVLDVAKEVKPGKIVVSIIKYMIASCLVESNDYEDLSEAVMVLQSLDKECKKRFPAVFCVLARAHCKLYRFKEGLQDILKGEEIFHSGILLESFYIPGTSVVIKQDMNDEIWKKVKLECSAHHDPDAVCYLENCNYISKPYVTPNRLIYKEDPAFKGMIIVHCNSKTNPCQLKFHPQCWKALKDQMYPIQKSSDVDMLGNVCLGNSSCMIDNDPSLMSRIQIIGKDGKIKDEFKSPAAFWSTGTRPKDKKENDGAKNDKYGKSDVKFETTPELQNPGPFSDDQILIVKSGSNGEVDFSHDIECVAQQKHFLFSIFYEYIKSNLVRVSDAYAKYNELGSFTDLNDIDIISFLLGTNQIEIWNNNSQIPISLSQDKTFESNDRYRGYVKEYDNPTIDNYESKNDFARQNSDYYDNIMMSDDDDSTRNSKNKDINKNSHKKSDNNNDDCEKPSANAVSQDKNLYKPIQPASSTHLLHNSMPFCNNSQTEVAEIKKLEEHITSLKSKLEEMQKENDKKNKQLNDKNYQIELLMKQLENNKEQWKSLNETIVNFKQNYSNVKDENLKLKNELIELMQDKEALESKLLESDDPESRRIQLLQDFQEEYKILEDQLKLESEKKSEELVKKALEKEIETRIQLLTKCLNNQYSSNRHLINGYIDHCNVTLDVINCINTWMANNTDIVQLIDNTEITIKMSCYTKALADNMDEYKMLMNKLQSNLPDKNELLDVALPYPSVPILPRETASDFVLRALDAVLDKHFERLQIAQQQAFANPTPPPLPQQPFTGFAQPASAYPPPTPGFSQATVSYGRPTSLFSQPNFAQQSHNFAQPRQVFAHPTPPPPPGFGGSLVPSYTTNFGPIHPVNNSFDTRYKQIQEERQNQMQMQVQDLQQKLEELHQKLSLEPDNQGTVTYPESGSDKDSESMLSTPRKRDNLKKDEKTEIKCKADIIVKYKDNKDCNKQNNQNDYSENSYIVDRNEDANNEINNCISNKDYRGQNHLINFESKKKDAEIQLENVREKYKENKVENVREKYEENKVENVREKYEENKVENVREEYERNKIENVREKYEENKFQSFFQRNEKIVHKENQVEKFSEPLQQVQNKPEVFTSKNDLNTIKSSEVSVIDIDRNNVVDFLTQKNSVDKPNKSSLDSLVNRFKAKYPGVLEADIIYIIFEIRKKHNNSLTGLTIRQILQESEEIFTNNQHIHLIQYSGIAETESTAKTPGLNYARLRSESVSSNNSYSPLLTKSLSNNVQTVEAINWDDIPSYAEANDANITTKNPGNNVQKKAWKSLNQEEITWNSSVDSECSICMNQVTVNNSYTLNCHHVFHVQCVKPWLKNDRSCPNCRMAVTEFDEFPPLPVT